MSLVFLSPNTGRFHPYGSNHGDVESSRRISCMAGLFILTNGILLSVSNLTTCFGCKKYHGEEILETGRSN